MRALAGGLCCVARQAGGASKGGTGVESPVFLLSVPGKISPYLNCTSGPSRRRVRAALASAGGRERGGDGEGVDS